MRRTFILIALALMAGCNSSPTAPTPEEPQGIRIDLSTSPHELEASEFWFRNSSGFHAAGRWNGEPVSVDVTLNQRGRISRIHSTAPVGCNLVYVEDVAIGVTGPSPGCEVLLVDGRVWRTWTAK